MKKVFNLLLVGLMSLVLVACGNSGATKTSASSSAESLKIQLVVKEDTNTIDEKVTADKGDTVMDVLKDNYKVVEKDGFITSIDGISQDEKAGKYWMFKVNGKMAPKAADKIKVKNGDKVEFYQEVYKQ
ncbi:DUF4430 domain-containing protein [Streptococcus sp. HF-1907]|uniref:DUF4430 domain-containing protein n=1 Tax=Streptococcus sp. HF-1907 TaxID=2785793 RepID=UPI0018A04691|nr:DUF4430 domain-containing protein [Streptococcus sp. HF-1907]MBF7094000.1 DUF4430 domain-containing protein [Streptococcus sp. HF-1907]